MSNILSSEATGKLVGSKLIAGNAIAVPYSLAVGAQSSVSDALGSPMRRAFPASTKSILRLKPPVVSGSTEASLGVSDQARIISMGPNYTSHVCLPPICVSEDLNSP